MAGRPTDVRRSIFDTPANLPAPATPAVPETPAAPSAPIAR
jgi:hypothetical protein